MYISVRRCSQCNFGLKYLLCQSQSQDQNLLGLLGTQATWGSSSTDYPGLRPRDCGLNMAINPACDVQNGFVHFCGHESTQSG